MKRIVSVKYISGSDLKEMLIDPLNILLLFRMLTQKKKERKKEKVFWSTKIKLGRLLWVRLAQQSFDM